ncbi:hypothetical protein S83_051252, partial [Arachis hypogaea]
LLRSSLPFILPSLHRLRRTQPSSLVIVIFIEQSLSRACRCHHHGLPRACRHRHVRRAVVVFLDAALNGFSLNGLENPNLHHGAIYLTVATFGAQDHNQVRPCCFACSPSRRSAQKATRLCLMVLLASVSRFFLPLSRGSARQVSQFCSPCCSKIKAAVSALWNTQGLNWPSSFEQQRQRTGDLDMLDWLKAMFGFQSSNRRRRKRKRCMIYLARNKIHRR